MRIIKFLFMLFFSTTKSFVIRKNYRHKTIANVNGEPDTFDYKILNLLRKQSTSKESIINRQNGVLYNINDLDYLKYKKVISISPGGIQGVYFMGIISFINDHYDLSNVIFTGASAGAWTSLFASYKYNTTDIVNDLLDYDYSSIKSILELQLYFKRKLLLNYNSGDFELQKFFLGVTVLKNLELSTNIFYNFEDLEDAIDCCIASSHIPLLTGGFINKYNNEISFDGGFSNMPYLNMNTTILNINPSLWNNNFEDYINYSDLLNINSNNFTKMYNDGYKNAKKNKNSLDKIFSI